MSVSAAFGGEQPGDWTGGYSPCDQHAVLLDQGRISLGVRFSTSNRVLAEGFAQALDYWAGVIDMNWHVEEGRDCAIQIVDGHPGLFRPGEAARAQFPKMPSFQGWIAFNPAVSLTPNEWFLVAVHEMGHVLGLPHSANASSVMYFLRLDGPAILDRIDLAALAAHHKLRAGVSLCPSQRADTSRSPDGCEVIRRAGSGSTSSRG